MFINWQYRLLALLLAISCWYLITGREKVDTWVQIPVELTKTPQGLIIRSGLKNNIDVRLRGPKGLIRAFNPRGIVYSLNLGNLKAGPNVYNIDPENIPVGRAFEVMETKPSRLDLIVEKISTRLVPVKVKWKGRIDSDFKVEKITVEPEAVKITGSESLIAKLEKVETQEITIPDGLADNWKSTVGLNLPQELEAANGVINVGFTLTPKLTQTEITVPLEIPPHSPDIEIQPKQQSVRLKLEMPAYLVKRNDLKNLLKVRLVLPPDTGKGKYQLTYKVDLPFRTELIQSDPEKIDVLIKDSAEAAKERKHEMEQEKKPPRRKNG